MSTFLRTEAQPMSRLELYPTQLEALQQLAAMLAEAVRALPRDPTSGDAASWLDDRRSSQVAILSGGRGMGKTSVMATLYRACRSSGDLDVRSEGSRGGAASDADSSDAWRTFAETIKDLRQRLVWLQPLDAERISPSTNLLSAILVRVERACRALNAARTDGSGPRGVLAPERNSPLERLKKLQTRIAIAWDENLRDRRANLDPMNMALESIQFEEAQLEFDTELNPTLEALARPPVFSADVNPLFVLPVDDFDLNPTACMALMRMMRMISSPRLFFLVLGDMDVASTVVRLHQTAELLRPVADVRDSAFLPIPPQEISRRAADVSENMLRKLAPPAQRIWLRSPDLAQAFQFRPLGSTADAPALHDLLARFPLSVSIEPSGKESEKFDATNLRDFLALAGREIALSNSGDGTEKAKRGGRKAAWELPANACYAARFALDTTLRRLCDLWYDCSAQLESLERRSRPKRRSSRDLDASSGAAGAEAQAAVVRFLQSDTKSLIQEEPVLSPQEREALSDSLHRVPLSGAAVAGGTWNLGIIPVHVETATYAARRLQEANVEALLAIEASSDGESPTNVEVEWDRDAVDPLQVEYVLQRAGERTMVFAHDVERRRAGGEWLRPQTAAMLSLLHDVVTIANAGENRGSLVGGKSHLVGDLAATVWRRGTEEVLIPWPAPPCATFAQLDRFAYAWNSFLNQVGGEDTRLSLPEVAVFAWVAASLSVVRLDSAPPVALRADQEQVVPWSELCDAIAGVALDLTYRPYSTERLLVENWLASLAWFSMPISWGEHRRFDAMLAESDKQHGGAVGGLRRRHSGGLRALFQRNVRRIEKLTPGRKSTGWRSAVVSTDFQTPMHLWAAESPTAQKSADDENAAG